MENTLTTVQVIGEIMGKQDMPMPPANLDLPNLRKWALEQAVTILNGQEYTFDILLNVAAKIADFIECKPVPLDKEMD